MTTQPTHLTIEVDYRSPASLWRNSQELVRREQASMAAWANTPAGDRNRILTTVRASLLRLLRDPSWVAGVIAQPKPGRLEVLITIDTDPEDVHRPTMTQQERDQAMAELRDALLEVAAEIGPLPQPGVPEVDLLHDEPAP